MILLLYTMESIVQLYVLRFSKLDPVVLEKLEFLEKLYLIVSLSFFFKSCDILPSVGNASIKSLITVERTFGDEYQLYRTKFFNDSIRKDSV